MPNRIFSTSDAAWQGMLAGISVAEKSIYLEMYIFDDDIIGNNFILSLEDAAKRGLRVVFILDFLGSHMLASKTVERLRRAGAEVLFYSFFLRRAHRKILIIDEKTAFIGGVNIRKRYSSWKDLQIRVTGRVVTQIVASFARVYKECGGNDAFLADISRKSIVYKTKLWFLERGVGQKRELLKKYYESRIDEAKQSIVLVTPYLLPPRWFFARLHQALLRGVEVEILMPRSSVDHYLANKLNYSYAAFLTELGVRCYFAPGVMNHAKAMLIDNREGLIGSQNIDVLSFGFNTEAGVFFDDQQIVSDLSKIINKWKAGAELFVHDGRGFHWYDIATAFILRLCGLLPLSW
jgi:cardiolipin synthase